MNWEEIVAEILAQGEYAPDLHPKAFKELEDILRKDALTGKMVVAAIIKLCKNPLPRDMGGLDNRLGKRKETGDLRPLLYGGEWDVQDWSKRNQDGAYTYACKPH